MGRPNRLADYDSLEKRNFVELFGRSMCHMCAKTSYFSPQKRPLPCHGTFGNSRECTGTEGNKQ